MSEIKALDKLRVSAEASFRKWVREDYRNQIADEIEAEVAGNYARLPCDADGVPIHIGDKLVKNGTVIGNVTGIGLHNEPRVWVLPSGKYVSVSFIAKDVKHCPPRTLEDVLRDVWKEALDYAKSDVWRNPDEVFAERASEIHELLDVGECKNLSKYSLNFECSVCGCAVYGGDCLYVDIQHGAWNHCPNCGRVVKR